MNSKMTTTRLSNLISGSSPSHLGDRENKRGTHPEGNKRIPTAKLRHPRRISHPVEHDKTGISMKTLLIFIFGLTVWACSKEDKESIPNGTWRNENATIQYYFKEGIACQVGEKVYMGLGIQGDDNYLENCTFLRFTLEEGLQSMPDFPGEARRGASAFVLGKKIYVGLGCQLREEGNKYFNDFWVFDTETDTWEKCKHAFPEEARAYAYSFAIDGKGYVGTGSTDKTAFHTSFMFDTLNGWKRYGEITWTLAKITGMFTFIANQTAYVHSGATLQRDSSYICTGSIYKLHAGDVMWAESSEHSEVRPRRKFASAFVLQHKGKEYAYIVGGLDDNDQALSSCWGYNPRSSQWEEKTPMPQALAKGVSFTLGNRGYIIGGTGAYSFGLED